jgi:hypothetical protein
MTWVYEEFDSFERNKRQDQGMPEPITNTLAPLPISTI